MLDPTDSNKRRERRGLVLVSGRQAGTQPGAERSVAEAEAGATLRTGASARDR